jgi:hypothetical protein
VYPAASVASSLEVDEATDELIVAPPRASKAVRNRPVSTNAPFAAPGGTGVP